MGQDRKDLGRTAGENLRRLMKERGLTQEDLADGYGVSVRTVQRWVSGGLYDVRRIGELAEFLGVDALTLLT